MKLCFLIYVWRLFERLVLDKGVYVYDIVCIEMCSSSSILSSALCTSVCSLLWTSQSFNVLNLASSSVKLFSSFQGFNAIFHNHIALLSWEKYDIERFLTQRNKGKLYSNFTETWFYIDSIYIYFTAWNDFYILLIF